jgi:ABC-type enterobactin transport system permease subunit
MNQQIAPAASSRLFSRPIGVTLALIMLCLLLALLALGSGARALSPWQTLQILLSHTDPQLQAMVLQWRLPRVMMALLLGAALSVSGALFQSLLHNPLGSPDVMGFNSGAYSGVLLVLVFFQSDPLIISAAALAGGLLTALLSYLLAWQQGINTLRLIMVGIGVRAMLIAANTWLLLNSSLDKALTAGLWNAGSLNGMTWAKSLPASILIIVAWLATASLSRPRQLLTLGDDTAVALGVAVEPSRIAIIVCAVSLTAAATAVAGPIAFIALAAPQIARRLCPGYRAPLILAALSGSALLLAADLAAQKLFLPYQLPVGLLTVSIGGLYLIGLLFRESQRS